MLQAPTFEEVCKRLYCGIDSITSKIVTPKSERRSASVEIADDHAHAWGDKMVSD